MATVLNTETYGNTDTIADLAAQYADALVAYHIDNNSVPANPVSVTRRAYYRLVEAQEALNAAALAKALAPAE